MKIIIMLLISQSLYAINFEVQNPCTNEVFTAVLSNEHDTVIGATKRAFKQLGITNKSNESGVQSIFNSPTGLDSIEVISDTEMKAFGWCYAVNGSAPEVLASDFHLNGNEDVIWWFGYALYREGNWITQCSKPQQKPFYCK